MTITTTVSSVLADVPQIDDRYVIYKSMDFLETDYIGAFNILDVFQEKTNLEKGHLFTMVDKYFDCETRTHIGKSIKNCRRTLTLESQDCGLEDTKISLEQIVSRSTTFTLSVTGGVCKVRVYNEENESMFGGLNEKSMSKSSHFKDYFVKLK